MTDLIQRLNAISRMQGRDPIDPITMTESSEKPISTGPADEMPWPPPFEEESSPLVDLARQRAMEANEQFVEATDKTVSVLRSVATKFQESALHVFDAEASFHGTTATLSQSEQNAIAAIILRAAQRTLKAQFKGLKITKRPYVRKAKPAVQAAAPQEVPVAPRKRGRPRKHPLPS